MFDPERNLIFLKRDLRIIFLIIGVFKLKFSHTRAFSLNFMIVKLLNGRDITEFKVEIRYRMHYVFLFVLSAVYIRKAIY